MWLFTAKERVTQYSDALLIEGDRESKSDSWIKNMKKPSRNRTTALAVTILLALLSSACTTTAPRNTSTTGSSGYILAPIANDDSTAVSSAVALRSVDNARFVTVDDVGPNVANVVVNKADPNRRFVLQPLGASNDDDSIDLNGDEYIKVIGSYFPKVVYSSPELDAKLLMRVAPGTRLPLQKMVDGWYRVTTEKGIGFIRTEDGQPTSADI